MKSWRLKRKSEIERVSMFVYKERGTKQEQTSFHTLHTQYLEVKFTEDSEIWKKRKTTGRSYSIITQPKHHVPLLLFL